MSLCTGECDICRFRKTVPGTDERIDREPAYICLLYDVEYGSYQEGYEDGYQAAIDQLKRWIMEEKHEDRAGIEQRKLH